MNIPGFKICYPSTAYDGKGLLKTAIREDDPVLFCEDRTVLGTRGSCRRRSTLSPWGLPISSGRAPTLTIVAIGGMVPRALAGRRGPGPGGRLRRGGGPPYAGAVGQGGHPEIGGQDGAAGDGGQRPQDVQRGQRDRGHRCDGGVLVPSGPHPEAGDGQRPHPLQHGLGVAMLSHSPRPSRRPSESPSSSPAAGAIQVPPRGRCNHWESAPAYVNDIRSGVPETPNSYKLMSRAGEEA